VIVALLDRREAFHQRAAAALGEITAPLVTCEPVIAESCHLLRRVAGARKLVLANVESGVFQLPLQLGYCASAIRRIWNKYRDHDIDLADAFLVHLGNEFSAGEILTLNRDFRIYRWGRNNPFRIRVPLD
jgi:uncharacterized protein